MNSPNLRGPILLSVFAAIVTIGLKAAAYGITGSIGLFSDALESGVNLLTAVAALFSLWYAARPVDANHTYGHEKIEFFSSGLEGGLVIAAGLGTAYYASLRLIEPGPIADLGLGATLALAASAINFVVARILLRVGRKHRSLLLETDGHHLMTDVWTSLGVVGGLGLVHLTGYREFDAALALAVGLHIIATGCRLFRRSFDGLMDHALSPADQHALRNALQAAVPDGCTFHHLRTRLAGRRRFADFHLLVPGDLTVREAHDLAHRVEQQVLSTEPDLELTIHIEPVEETSSWEADELARLGEETGPPMGVAP